MLYEGLRAEGEPVSLSRLCRGLGVPRRSLYYRPRGRRRPVDPDRAAAVQAVIERFPTYGYRRIAAVLGWNRKVVQRICQRRGWQVANRPKGHRPRAQALGSVAPRPDRRWATDLTRVWCGRDRWCTLAVVLDCCTREVLGWRLARSGDAKTAEAALEEALIHRFGALGRLSRRIVLRSDNGLVFSSRRYTATVRAYGLEQEFITPYTPEQNGLVERCIRSLKEECIWQHRFESLPHARQVIGAWVRYYNTERPHQALAYKAPAHVVASAA